MKGEKSDIKTNKCIYVDIDSLFDTRLPILNILFPSVFEEVVKNGSYFKRVKDVFGTVGYDTFHCLYRNRSKPILQYVTATYIDELVKDRYAELITDLVNLDVRDDICIYLNTYPYMLNVDEQENMVDGICKLIGGTAPIKIIYVSNYELTTEWIADHVTTVFKYDALDWLNTQTALHNLIKKPLLDIDIIAPALAHKSVKNSEVTKKHFELIMNTYKAFANIMLIDAEYFSSRTK